MGRVETRDLASKNIIIQHKITKFQGLNTVYIQTQAREKNNADKAKILDGIMGGISAAGHTGDACPTR